MVVAIANIQTRRQFERGCFHESYVGDAVLQSIIITYTVCVIIEPMNNPLGVSPILVTGIREPHGVKKKSF